MGVEPHCLYHVQRYGAVGKPHLACGGVYAGRVGLETGHSQQRFGDCHRQQGGHIALAAGHDAFSVEPCQRHAPCVVHGIEQVEAAQREAVQVVVGHQLAQGPVDAHGTGQCRLYGGCRGLCHRRHTGSREPGVAGRGCGGRQVFIAPQQFLHRYLHQGDAPPLIHGVGIGMARDEPVGGFSHYAQTHAAQLFPGLSRPCQQLQPGAHHLAAAVYDFSFQPLLPQIRQYLHRSRQRVALARCEQVERFVGRLCHESGQQPLEDTLCAARAHIEQVERMLSVVAVVGAAQHIGHVQTVQELLCGLGDGRRIVQFGGEGVDGYIFHVFHRN